MAGLVNYWGEIEAHGSSWFAAVELVLESIAYVRNQARGPIKIGRGTQAFPSASAALVHVSRTLIQKCEINHVREFFREVQAALPGKSPVEMGNILQTSLTQRTALEKEIFDYGPFQPNPKITELFHPAKASLSWRHGAFLAGIRFIAEWLQRLAIDFQSLRTELELELAGRLSSLQARPKSRRRNHGRRPRKLTARQIEAAQLMAEHKGNATAAAKAAGISRQALQKHYNVAMAKLGRSADILKPKTERLPKDRRGQELVADEQE